MIKRYEKDLYVINKQELTMLMEAYINLNALETTGVDNWESYGEALDIYFEDERTNNPNYGIDDEIKNWLNKIHNDSFFSNISGS